MESVTADRKGNPMDFAAFDMRVANNNTASETGFPWKGPASASSLPAVHVIRKAGHAAAGGNAIPVRANRNRRFPASYAEVIEGDGGIEHEIYMK